MTKKWLKIIGWVSTGVGLVANVISSLIEEKTVEMEIQEQVVETLRTILPVLDDENE